MVKRIIAVGGQTVECCDDKNRVLVDGKPLDEPYIYWTPAAEPRQASFAPLKVPEGMMFVLGDNRNNSSDSRYQGGGGRNGLVPVDNVIGKVRWIVLPPSRWQGVGDHNPQGAATAAATAGTASRSAVVSWPRGRRCGSAAGCARPCEQRETDRDVGPTGLAGVPPAAGGAAARDGQLGAAGRPGPARPRPGRRRRRGRPGRVRGAAGHRVLRAQPGDAARFPGLTDSKLLTAAARDRMYDLVVARAVDYAVVVVPVEEVDLIGVHVSNIEGMRRAIAQLRTHPGYVLIDGFRVPGLTAPSMPVIKGDQAVACVAAASVLAKVTRDRIMAGLHEELPMYGFDEHKGYCTVRTRRRWPSTARVTVHRWSFVNVASAGARAHGMRAAAIRCL